MLISICFTPSDLDTQTRGERSLVSSPDSSSLKQAQILPQRRLDPSLRINSGPLPLRLGEGVNRERSALPNNGGILPPSNGEYFVGRESGGTKGRTFLSRVLCRRPICRGGKRNSWRVSLNQPPPSPMLIRERSSWCVWTKDFWPWCCFAQSVHYWPHSGAPIARYG